MTRGDWLVLAGTARATDHLRDYDPPTSDRNLLHALNGSPLQAFISALWWHLTLSLLRSSERCLRQTRPHVNPPRPCLHPFSILGVNLSGTPVMTDTSPAAGEPNKPKPSSAGASAPKTPNEPEVIAHPVRYLCIVGVLTSASSAMGCTPPLSPSGLQRGMTNPCTTSMS